MGTSEMMVVIGFAALIVSLLGVVISIVNLAVKK